MVIYQLSHAMIGSAYLPSWRKNILFVEDIGEDIYRIDRMLTSVKKRWNSQSNCGFYLWTMHKLQSR